MTDYACRRKGIEARRHYVEPVGAWFSQVGRLHQVYHMWQYAYVLSPLTFGEVVSDNDCVSDLATRKEKREEAWKLDGWSETVAKVSLTQMA